ncbi:MAG: hypothetical protein IJ119_15905 [Clostridia bacterium]|nr:hypothetical protein [Clostridia bacterium]
MNKAANDDQERKKVKNTMAEPRPMKRRAGQSVEEMAEQLAESSAGNKLNKASSYPEISAAVKAQVLASAIDTTEQMMQDVAEHGRVDLNDLQAVRSTASRYLAACKQASVVPGMSGLACALGISRQRLYRFIADDKGESARYLDALRTGWSAILEQMTLSRAVSEACGIFLLKNAGTDLSDKTDVSMSVENNARAAWYERDDLSHDEFMARMQAYLDEGSIVTSDAQADDGMEPPDISAYES